MGKKGGVWVNYITKECGPTKKKDMDRVACENKRCGRRCPSTSKQTWLNGSWMSKCRVENRERWG